jgi:hypothetical protein
VPSVLSREASTEDGFPGEDPSEARRPRVVIAARAHARQVGCAIETHHVVAQEERGEGPIGNREEQTVFAEVEGGDDEECHTQKCSDGEEPCVGLRRVLRRVR